MTKVLLDARGDLPDTVTFRALVLLGPTISDVGGIVAARPRVYCEHVDNGIRDADWP